MSHASALAGRALAAGRRITRAPEWPLTAAFALALLSLSEVVLRGADGGDLPIKALLALAATMPLALVRGHAAAVAGSVTAAVLLTHAGDHRLTGAALAAQATALYLAGRRESWRWSAWVPVVGLYAALARSPVLALALPAWAAGVLRRTRAEAGRRDASSRAIADRLLEHAARGERARIARELHDVVAHHISMIAVQAETARLTTPGMPDEGARRLLAIGDTARAALTEMRRLLGVLREDAGTEVARTPQPGLDQLNELIDEAREHAGASTRLIVRGRVTPLDPGVQLTAFRIVQEALTNARRHAPGAAVDVELHYGERALRLRVRDNGPGVTDAGHGGHGVLGMRERAAMVGGTLRIGAGRTGGCVVEAVLPAHEPAG